MFCGVIGIHKHKPVHINKATKALTEYIFYNGHPTRHEDIYVQHMNKKQTANGIIGLSSHTGAKMDVAT